MRRHLTLRSALVGALALVLLTGCAGFGDAGTASSSDSPSSGDGTEVSSAASADLVPAGFPEGFDCETVGELATGLTGGLYPNELQQEDEGYMTCAWSDVPLDTVFPRLEDKSTDLDVVVKVDFLPLATAGRNEAFCAGDGSTRTELGGHYFDRDDECAGGALGADDFADKGVWASIPYFDLSLRVSCDMSVDCAPVLPAHFHAEAGYHALRQIADELVDGLEFVSADDADDAGTAEDADEALTGRAVLVAWAEASFPAVETDSQWYCSEYTLSTQGYDWLAADAANGFAWTLSDEPTLTAGGVPVYLLDFADDAAGAYTTYRIALSDDGCIEDIDSGSY